LVIRGERHDGGADDADRERERPAVGDFRLEGVQ